MENICKSLSEKISSYDLFNNFYPGIIFCYLIESTTRFSFVSELDLLEKIFVYYFAGMIMSRIGSVVIEKMLKKIKIRNKETKEQEDFLRLSTYEQYIETTEERPLIAKLSEVRNTYRTLSVVFILAFLVKLYDWLLADRLNEISNQTNTWIIVIIFALFSILFVISFRKQAIYIRGRIENYYNEKAMENKEEK